MTTTSTPGLAELREAHSRALSERDRAAADLERAKSDADEQTADLASKLGLGEITAGEYDQARQAASDRIAAAVETLERAEAVLSAVSERAADQAEAEAEMALEPLRGAVEAEGELIRELTGKLVAARARLDEADDTLSLAEAEKRHARAEFDEEARRAASEQARADSQLIRWHCLNPAGAAPPVRLRAAVEQARERMREEHEQSLESMRRRAEASLRAAGYSMSPEQVAAYDAEIMRG